MKYPFGNVESVMKSDLFLFFPLRTNENLSERNGKHKGSRNIMNCCTWKEGNNNSCAESEKARLTAIRDAGMIKETPI